VPPIPNPRDRHIGTYFQRNYREGERIEILDLADWGCDLPGWGVSPDPKKKGRKWDPKEKKQFKQNIAQDEWLPGEWIDWKDHRLKKLAFYLPSAPPKRAYRTSEAPPRLVLRENPYPPYYNGSLKPKPGFPSLGHLEFKIWLQHKIEDVAHGRASPNFLSGQGRTKEEAYAESKWNELTEKFRDVLEVELLSNPNPNKKLSTEVQHILLMHKIIGRKTGPISPLWNLNKDPYWRVNLKNLTPTQMTKQILQYQVMPPDILDKICRQIVKFLIGKSKTTLPTRRKVYRFVSKKYPAQLLRYAKNTARHPKTKRKAKIDLTPDEVRVEIENDPIFWKWGKFNPPKFEKVIWVRNERNSLHSKTVPELKKRLDILSLNKGGKKDKLLLRLFKHEHENQQKVNLTIDNLVKLKIDPPDDWQFADVHLPAITFFESLNKASEVVVWEALKEVEEIAKNSKDQFELRDPSTGLENLEHKLLKILLLPLKWDPGTLGYAQVKENGGLKENGGFGSRRAHDKSKTPEKITRHNARKLIYNIIMILMEEGYIKFEGMTDDNYRLHFPNSNTTKGHLSRGPKAKVHAIHFTEKLKGLIGKSEYQDFKGNKEHPIYRLLRRASDRWMYSPPQRHKAGKSPQAGGLLIEKDRSITNSSNRDYEKLDTPRCVANRGVLDAMNALQETQWEINLHLLQALFNVSIGENKSLSDYPVREWINQEQFHIKKITPKRIFRKVFEQMETLAEEEEMLEWVEKIIEHNANVFWHAWELDFTGRLYPKCTRLSPHGNDLNKAMIRFKHWKPLGKEKNDCRGIDWIHIHVHTMMEDIDVTKGNSVWKSGPAQKKQTFKTRIKWVRDNLELLRKMAKNPGKDEYRKILRLHEQQPGKDDVYQRLAALLELDRAHTEYEDERNGQDWSKVYSGHPIYLDATCNGYQHASTLLGNRKLAELVNVVGKPGGDPRDLYDEVAKAAKRMSVGTKHLTVAQLQTLAKAQGLPRYSKLNKADLVTALRSHIPLMKSANAVRVYLEKIPLTPNQLKIAINQIFDRSVAKKPTMTSAYGSPDHRKSFEGKGKEGKSLFWAAKKTQKEIDDDEVKLDNLEKEKKIPSIYRDYYLRLKKTTTPYLERDILRKELQKMKDKYGLSNKKYEEYKHWILPTKTCCIWNDGSSLAVAILGKSELRGKLNPKEEGFLIDGQSRFREKKTPQKKLGSYLGKEDALDPVVREIMDKRARRQHELTGLVNQAYKDAIKFVTKGAFETIQEDLEKVAEDGNPNPAPKTTESKGDGLWPGVVWHLPQNDKKGFRVNHYRINKPNPSISRRGNPCRPEAVFNDRLPDWYTVKKYNGKGNDKEKARILQRLEELYGTNPKVSKALKAKGGSRRKIDEVLEIVDPQKQDKDAEEIRRILRYRNISRYEYEEDEWRRIDNHPGRVNVEIKKLEKAKNRKPTADELRNIKTSNHRLTSSLLPNFIHSIDAYHMRETIHQCDIGIDDLSFWSVHDAFGTHACDVETMVGIVKRTFYNIHRSLDFEGWIGPRSKDLTLKHILDSEYIIN